MNTTVRKDYKIVAHKTPVWKHGGLRFYKVMYKDPLFGWIYLEDAVSLEEAEDSISAMIEFANSDIFRKELALYE